MWTSVKTNIVFQHRLLKTTPESPWVIVFKTETTFFSKCSLFIPAEISWICSFFSIRFHPLLSTVRERERGLKSDISLVPSCFRPSAVIIKSAVYTRPTSFTAGERLQNHATKVCSSAGWSCEGKKKKRNSIWYFLLESREMVQRSARLWNESNLELPGELCPVQPEDGVLFACQSRRF